MELEPSQPTSARWLDSLPEQARRHLPPAVWAYVHAGAREGTSTAEATAAWRDVRFRTRVLRDGGEPDLGTRILGHGFTSPLGVAPTAMQPVVHAQGERGMARGAEAAGCLHVVSSNAGTPFADLGARHWWLQAYLPPDREDFLPVAVAAAAAGATALVLTVDTPYPGTKYAADEADWTGIDLSWWRVNYPRRDPEGALWKAVTADDVGWLGESTGLPVVVKGVLRGDDALRAVEAGAAAVYVSNHGGRQLDRSVSTARALPEVIEAVGDRTEVYVDGGVRSGLDALAALALGARAVFLGRPALQALAVDGARGVERLLSELSAELADALALAGCRRPEEAPDLLPAAGTAGR
ncbi:alpha-hydroxy-acid oxidizing protein [Nocardioides cynanchi]|uniref:alpha-hydroxy-acid oxidizing protein n=1 Tax=Nocardioides cynanchi TaxID=2558918 RepID=UPI001245CBEF|nr:alpha-hydroxy-acid oxidizing protein [Nocardioides cynanchi]